MDVGVGILVKVRNVKIVLREKENTVEVSIRGNLEKYAYGKDDVKGFIHDVLVVGLKKMGIEAEVIV